MARASSRRRLALVAAAIVVLLAGLVPALAFDGPEPLDRFAFVARNDVPFDALSVGPIAGSLGGITVITPPSMLSAPARDALQDFDPDTVYIVGGTSAISTTTESQIEMAGTWDVERVAGSGRDDTARLLGELPAAIGYERPVVTQNGQIFGGWSDDYAFGFHDHGVNPGAGGDDARRGGVVHSQGDAVAPGTTPTVVASLTVKDAMLRSRCPVGTPLHNLLVEASSTITSTLASSVEVAVNVDSTDWPVDGSDPSADEPSDSIRAASLTDAGQYQTLSTHYFQTVPETGSDHTVHLLARVRSGAAAEIERATLEVLNLGYECSP